MRFRKRMLALSAAAAIAPLRGAIAANATWVPLGGSSSWNNSANWNTNIVPNGSGDGAYFTDKSGGPVVLLGNSTITLSTLDLSDPLFTSVVGGTINLTGAAVINASGSNFDLPELVIPAFGTISVTGMRPGNNLGGTGTLALGIIGSNGLNKTGDTHLQIDSPQFYSGTTTISGGGKIISTIGDSAFGNAANAIALNNGSIQISGTDWNTSRVINVGSLGGSIYWVGSSRTATFNGDLTGAGSLQLNGRFALSSDSIATFSTANSLTGTLDVGGGTIALRGSGAFINTPYIINSGTIILDHTNSGGAVDRISDSGTLIMRGGALTAKTLGTSYQENIGTTVLDGGLSVITVDPGTGGASINLGTFIRGGTLNNAAGLFVAGTNLGSTPGANNANLFISGGTSLLVNGILPFAYGNSTLTSAESSTNGLLTYGINGITPVVGYGTDLTTSTSATNLRLTSNATLSAPASVNALVLAAPDNLIVANGAAGLLVSGSGPITVASGVILSANAGLNGSGTTVTGINSLPGNIIQSAVNLQGSSPVIMTPSALRITGVVSGSGGLTKIGGRTLTLTGLNTYTGRTLLTGFTRFTGNVFDNVTSTGDNPFGRDPSSIVIYGGNAAPSGTGFGELVADNPGSTFFNRSLDLRGDQVLLRSIGVSSLSLGTINWGGTITISDPNTVLTFLSSKSFAHQIVTGSITGPGRVIIGAADPNPGNPVNSDAEETWVDLMGTSTFQGGLVLAGGTVGIGNDQALGGTLNGGVFNAGTVQVAGNTLIAALNGPRTLSNSFIVYYGATLGIGTNGTASNFGIELTGEINGRGGDYLANITNTQPTTFSGALTGGGLTKTGAGTLVLSGDNTFTGVLNVGNGSTTGGMVIITNSTALGSTLGPTGVDYGSTAGAGTQNTLALDGTNGPGGGLNIPEESIFLRGNGVASLGALYNLAGNNVIRGTVSPSATYINVGTTTVSAPASLQFAAIGVNAGSTLTLANGIIADDGGASNGTSLVFSASAIGLRKVGNGALRVGSHAVLSPDGTTQFNGAIVVTGSLDVRSGTIVIQSHTGVPTLSSGRSLVDVGSLNFVLGTGTLSTVPVGQLDLADNAMIIDYTGSSPLPTVRSYLRNGFANGLWNGNGIISSVAATSPNPGEAGYTAISYVEATDVGLSSLLGDPFSGAAILLRYGYSGDANFDGKVDVSDLTAIALHWQQSAGWIGGDFNYDGFVDIKDLRLMVLNWDAGVSSPLPQASLAAAMADLGLPDVSVPESTQILPLIFASISLFSRRRRRAQSLFVPQIES